MTKGLTVGTLFSLQLTDRGGGCGGSSVKNSHTSLTGNCHASSSDKLHQLGEGTPRTSILGKPLVGHRTNRRDIKYRKLQAKLYNFLERPSGRAAAIYHGCV